MRTYIPLNALRAFEAAARHLSISRAADELCVTPTAISHQIKSLEGFLEAPLFERRNGKLALAPATVNALSELSEGFDKLEAALMSLNRRGQRRKLVVAASPSMASLWLMPKLDRFLAREPGVDLSLITATCESDFADGPYDVAIASRGEAPGRRCDYLMDEKIFPVCAPALLAGASAEELLRDAPLIHDDKVTEQFPTWSRYFQATQQPPRDACAGLRFNQSSLAIEAAMRGHGLLLARGRLVAPALADGGLVRLRAAVYPGAYGYYAVRPRGADAPLALRFIEWLTAEIEAEDRSSIFEPVRVPVRPDERRRLPDIDRRGEKRLVGDQGRGVGAGVARNGHAHRRPQIFDIGHAAAEAGRVGG
jgi:LysR family glycine cleavage system transcriptional activator